LENKKKGILGEKIAKEDYEQNGYSIISTRIGSDFIAYKKTSTKLYQEYVEVKTGRARQSATQRKKMRVIKRMGINYTIYRITEKFLANYSDRFAEKTSNKVYKKENLYSIAGDP
jgi:Holliday junction resolvase-like predicted endonuclease